MRALVFALGVAFAPSAALGGAFDRHKIYEKLGFAEAAVEACPRLVLNPAGVLALVTSLDADDQAAFGSGLAVMARQKQSSQQLFALLGDRACDAALDFEEKLGIDIFSEN
jgi:hypothetical protein